MINQLKELNDFLHEFTFIEKDGGFVYKFINETINVNGQPVCNYSLELINTKFYFHHKMPLTNTSPLWLIIEGPSIGISITLFDEINNRHVITLLPTK